jgi:hypothetical protein
VLIELTRGFVTEIDDPDFGLIARYRWHATGSGDYIYAATKVSSRKLLYLHRLLLGAPAETSVDHINGNRLDNTRKNLRTCSHAENMRNRRTNENSKSGVKGVYWDARRNKWRSGIKANGIKYDLGAYQTLEDAAAAYAKAAAQLHGQFASY